MVHVPEVTRNGIRHDRVPFAVGVVVHFVEVLKDPVHLKHIELPYRVPFLGVGGQGPVEGIGRIEREGSRLQPEHFVVVERDVPAHVVREVLPHAVAPVERQFDPLVEDVGVVVQITASRGSRGPDERNREDGRFGHPPVESEIHIQVIAEHQGFKSHIEFLHDFPAKQRLHQRSDGSPGGNGGTAVWSVNDGVPSPVVYRHRIGVLGDLVVPQYPPAGFKFHEIDEADP